MAVIAINYLEKRKKRIFIILILFLFFYFLIIGIERAPWLIDDTRLKITTRSSLWRLALENIQEYPFFGVGINQIRQIPSVGYEASHVHNHLFQIAVELGIIALIAYLAIVIGAGWMCIKIWKKAKTNWMKTAIIGLGAGQIAHGLFGVLDSIPLGAKTSIFFWISLGLITSMYNLTITDGPIS
jgi:O-antigen ligase